MSAPDSKIGNVETVLTSVWSELLGVAEISADDNFIEMGGNSLLATILATRFEEEAGIALDIQDIFQLSYGQLIERFNG